MPFMSDSLVCITQDFMNLEKCEFNKGKIVFFGVTFSKEGISPNPKKVTALKDMFHQYILQNFVVYLV
jgi:hypothetical protein